LSAVLLLKTTRKASAHLPFDAVDGPRNGLLRPVFELPDDLLARLAFGEREQHRHSPVPAADDQIDLPAAGFDSLLDLDRSVLNVLPRSDGPLQRCTTMCK